ncbi:MAG: guanylate kinase [Dehalococcoidia bacterium]
MATAGPAQTPDASAPPPNVYDGPLLLVLSGPSGAGKDAVRDELRCRRADTCHFVVTVNSRPRRGDEVEGIHYHFVSDTEFAMLRERGGLLEWEQYAGSYRGSPRAEVESALAAGKDTVLRMDVRGARTIKRLAPWAVLIFIRPPSIAALSDRMRSRGSETPVSLAARGAMAIEELAQIDAFDYQVLNIDGELDRTVDQVEAIITAERCRVGRRPVVIDNTTPVS